MTPTPETIGVFAAGLVVAVLVAVVLYYAGRNRGWLEGYGQGASAGYLRGRRDERKETEGGR